MIVELIGCSHAEASRLVGVEDAGLASSERTFLDDIYSSLGIKQRSEPRLHRVAALKLLPEFEPVRDAGRCRVHAFPYMHDRGYSAKQFLRLAGRFRLHYASRGAFSYRIIIPVYMDGELVNWTGRTVARNVELRYRSLSTDTEKAAARQLPVAPMNIKECLLDYDMLKQGGDTLVVCEGPFDALRVTFLGERYGIYGTCLFGKNWTPQQSQLLMQLGHKFDERVVLLDRDAGLDLEKLFHFRDVLGFQPISLPKGVGDPAELSTEAFRRLFQIK